MYRGNVYKWCLWLLFATSCSEQGSFVPVNEDIAEAGERIPLEIGSRVGVSVTGIGTRGLLEKTLPENGKVGIFGISYYRWEGSPLPEIINQKQDREEFEIDMFNAGYTYRAGSGTLVPDKQAYFMYGSSACMALYAYYPHDDSEGAVVYDAQNVKGWVVNWKQDMEMLDATPDYLYMPRCIAEARNGGSVRLSDMQHVFGGVEVYVYTQDEEISNMYGIRNIWANVLSAEEGGFSLLDGKSYWKDANGAYTRDNSACVQKRARAYVTDSRYPELAATQEEAMTYEPAISFVLPEGSEILTDNIVMGFGRNGTTRKNVVMNNVGQSLKVTAGKVIRICVRIDPAETPQGVHGTKAAGEPDWDLESTVIIE